MVQTNNSYLADKVALRAGHLPGADPIRVLDCFAGDEKIWKAVKKITGRRILTLPVDIKQYAENAFYLPGDNLVYLKSLDLSRFDAIDLDAYRVPYDQLEIVFQSQFNGMLYVTFIQSVFGGLPHGLLCAIGFTVEQLKTIPTMFGRSGWFYFKQYLAARGVASFYHRSHERKHYLAINCAERSVLDYRTQTGGSLANPA